jgi:chemotaxis response regulator CheB
MDQSDCKELVIINSGASSPAAMLKLLTDLSHGSERAIVLMKSIPTDLIPLLAEFMDQRSRISIVPIMDHVKLENNKVYISTTGSGIELLQKGNGYTLYAEEDAGSDAHLMNDFDRFLISVAQTFVGKINVILLSGADIESLDGLEKIEEINGSIIIQDRKTCIMPGSLDFVKNSYLNTEEVSLLEMDDYLSNNILRL